MKILKIFSLSALIFMLSGCSVLSELTALKKCEFSFHSAQDPVLAGINVMEVNSFSDLSLMNGQKILSNILAKRMPFGITVNVEARNPGLIDAAVNEIEWVAYIDDMQISSGTVDQRIEIPANGGTTIIPVRVESDLFQYMEGDNPRTMLNFALNLIDAGGQPTRLSMKIKPSVNIGASTIKSPKYFTISKEFSTGI